MHVFSHKIGEIVVSDEVWNKRFSCDLAECKGSCCRIGDLGATVMPEEAQRLTGHLPRVLPLLPEKNRLFLAQGLTETYEGRLHIREMARNHPCPLGRFEGSDVLLCSLHQLAGMVGQPVESLKPLWCQLYPLIFRDTPSGCIINFYDAWFCRSNPDPLPVLLAFAPTLEKLLGAEFVEQVRERYLEEGAIPPRK